MGVIADYLKGKLAEHVFRPGFAYTAPTGYKVRLHTGDPGNAGSANLVAGGAYADQVVAAFGAADANGLCANTADITFPVATANWGLISHVSVTDQANNVLHKGPATVSQTVNTGNQYVIRAGDLKVGYQ